MELRQIIFHLLEMQIQFGVHRFGDVLPTIKEASGYFLASADTVRLAYQRLKQKGYLSISTCVGATVKVKYSDDEVRQHVQDYFACRKAPLLAFAQSVGLLANHAQWFAFKRAAPETLDELERICFQKHIPPVYRMSRQLQLLYSPLGNDLLLRLFWQMFLYFQAPFVSAPQNIETVNRQDRPILRMVQLARNKDWTALWNVGEETVKAYYDALRRFFEKDIQVGSDGEPVDFTWGIYKKASQLCYSLCTEILAGVGDGVYPVGCLLPSPQRLAGEKQIGLNTVRRSICLLNKLGATRSVNGVGTLVLTPLECARNCDFSDAVIQKRLLGFLQSIHLLSFSCRACARVTVAGLDADQLRQWLHALENVQRLGNYEGLLYICYRSISRYAPYHAIRTIYSELTQQFLWGFPLQRLHGDRASINAYFSPYLEALMGCLARADADGFSAKLEELQLVELAHTAQYLTALGVQEASVLVLPDKVV